VSIVSAPRPMMDVLSVTVNSPIQSRIPARSCVRARVGVGQSHLMNRAELRVAVDVTQLLFSI
jgi:hypothetical protein